MLKKDLFVIFFGPIRVKVMITRNLINDRPKCFHTTGHAVVRITSRIERCVNFSTTTNFFVLFVPIKFKRVVVKCTKNTRKLYFQRSSRFSPHQIIVKRLFFLFFSPLISFVCLGEIHKNRAAILRYDGSVMHVFQYK